MLIVYVCLLQGGSNKNQTQTFGQGDGAMNDLITAYEIVCYKVNAVHYLNQSQGTHMVNLNHALQNAAAAILPCVIQLRPVCWTVFLGWGQKGSAAVILERPTDCRNCESARVEMMIPLSGPQRQPSATKMERGHQKHLQWQQWLSFGGVTRITTWKPCKNVIYYGTFFSILVFEKQNRITANNL